MSLDRGMLNPGERPLLTAQYLDVWLIKATKGLVRESYDRVREEIVDHFNEALDTGVDSGLSPDAAAQRAVDALGPPRAARRQFRRTYLTKTQAGLVRSFAALPDREKPGWIRQHSRLVLGIALTLITSIAVLVDPGPGRSQSFGLICVAVMALGAIALSLAPRVFRSGRERTAVVLGSSAEAAVWGGYLLAFSQGSSPHSWLLALLLVVLAVTVAPVLSKLPRHAPASKD
ncbi:MAG: hypothetical protein GKS06_10025 [Acidobacteria bacterium]|nr:hypothetical protein [Acidobacteriota bacterium]